MINIKRSKTIKNGLSLNNKTGIFECSGNPSLLDSGVPQSSLALDYTTPALYFKHGNTTSSWKRLDNINGSGGPPIGSKLLAILSEEYPSGEGGGYGKNKEWHERSINKINKLDPSVFNTGDDIDLPSGTFLIKARAFGSEQKRQKLRINNETLGVIIDSGASVTEGNPEVSSIVTLTTRSLLSIEHYVVIDDEHKEEDDLFILGKPVKDGSPEVYLYIEVWSV